MRLAEEDLQMFPNVDEYLREKDVNQQMIAIVQQPLQSLTESFGRYFLKKEDPKYGNMWIIDPCATNIENNNLNMNEKYSLIDLSSDYTLKTNFQSSLSKFHFFCSTLKVNTHCSVKKQFYLIFNNIFMRKNIFICHNY